MAKLSRCLKNDGSLLGYMVTCPGCGYGHLFNTVPWTRGTEPGPVWTFDGNMESPTFSPSMLVNKNHPEARCHSFVRAGKIQFLDDCFHELKGQTVDLPECDW